MTKKKRIIEIIIALFMIFLAGLMFVEPVNGLKAASGILVIVLTVRGLREIVFYLHMARSMVGGKTILFIGLLFLAVGIFISDRSRTAEKYFIIYLAVFFLITGAVSILRANEARSSGSPHWKLKAAQGLIEVILAIAVLISGLVFHSDMLTAFVFSLQLISSAVIRIITACRKTAIVYIQ